MYYIVPSGALQYAIMATKPTKPDGLQRTTRLCHFTDARNISLIWGLDRL
jgi:hypothetical protein